VTVTVKRVFDKVVIIVWSHSQNARPGF